MSLISTLSPRKYGLTNGKFYNYAVEFFEEPSSTNDHHLKDLLTDFMQFYGQIKPESVYFDVIIKSTDPNEECLSINSTIFAARSNTFDDIYRSNDISKYDGFTKETINDKVVITIPPRYKLSTFELVFNYIFWSHLNESEETFNEETCKDIFVLASFLDLKHLRRSKAAKLHKYFTHNNAIDYLKLSKEHECRVLKKFIFEYILMNKREIMNANKQKWNEFFSKNSQLLDEIVQSAAEKNTKHNSSKSSVV
jgi:hypothetical protein